MDLRLRSNEARGPFPRKPSGRRVFCPWPALARPVTARCGDAPASPPWPRPISLAAAPFRIFRQALRNGCIVQNVVSLPQKMVTGVAPVRFQRPGQGPMRGDSSTPKTHLSNQIKGDVGGALTAFGHARHRNRAVASCAVRATRRRRPRRASAISRTLARSRGRLVVAAASRSAAALCRFRGANLTFDVGAPSDVEISKRNHQVPKERPMYSSRTFALRAMARQGGAAGRGAGSPMNRKNDH